MKSKNQWLDWAIELQALAQAGIHYAKDGFDTERYSRIREIAAEIICENAKITLNKTKSSRSKF